MLVSKLHDAMRKRCREKHVEPLLRRREAAKKVANVFDESEVEHAIRFIQHDDLDLVELEYALLEIVNDSAGRADQDIHTILDVTALFLIIGAAIGERDRISRVLAEDLCVLGDLHGQFARRRQNEDPGLLFMLCVRRCR